MAVLPAPASAQVRVAIAAVELGGDLTAEVRDAVAGALAAGLMPTSSSVLLPGELGLEAGAPAGRSPEALAETGRRAGAEAVVAASFDQREQHYAVTVELVLARDASRLATTSLACPACTWEEALATVTRAARGLGSSLPGLLSVRATPAEATVSVDGQPLTGPGPLALAPGAHQVVATGEGGMNAEQRVTIVAGGLSEVSLTLAPHLGARGSGSRARGLRIGAWITGIAGVGALVPGAVWLALDGECPIGWSGVGRNCPEIYDTSIIGLVALIVGAGLLAASAGLFVAGYRRPRAPAAVATSPVTRLGGPGPALGF
jgi:hypothetical protein